MKITVHRYQPEFASHWAQVLHKSKNSVFLFERAYMEYHADRFFDLSMIAFSNDEPVAAFPVARSIATNDVGSHPGLTFGGIALKQELRGDAALSIIDALLDSLRDSGVDQLTVKMLPHIFSRYPSEELSYALWRRGFALSRRDLSSVLPLANPFAFNTSKRQAVSRAQKHGLCVTKSNVADFHKLLSEVLEHQHEATPVHSASELEMLATRFPENIIILGAWRGDCLLAGSMVFKYGHVWHTQYLACSSDGRECGALDLVISELKNEAISAGVKYLSFGISTEASGKRLNEGLLWQKESFGARSITHDFMLGHL